jgi:hypothetical protein
VDSVQKPADQHSIVELAEMTAKRRAPSSPRRKQRARELRRIGVGAGVLCLSALVYLWLLLA